MVWSQHIAELEFRNQPIVDILLVLGRAAGQTIVPDDTVTGTASYYFVDTEFSDALQLFLSTYGLFTWRSNDVHYVSRIRTRYNRLTGVLSVFANDAEVESVVRRISAEIGRTILFDPLPDEEITIQAEGVTVDDALEMIVRRFPDYEIIEEQEYHYITRRPRDAVNLVAGSTEEFVTRDGDLYSIEAERVRLREVIDSLFTSGGREYSYLRRGDVVIESIAFRDKSFEELLRLALQLGESDYTVQNDIYYIYELNRSDVLKQLAKTIVVPLQHLVASDLPNLFPSDLSPGNLYRIDSNTNAIILSGSPEEIDPIERFLVRIDQPLEGKRYVRFDLAHIAVDTAINALPNRLKTSQPVPIEGKNTFVMLLSDRQSQSVGEYLDLIDVAEDGYPITLRYIRSDDLIENLPPSVTADHVVSTASPTLVFFRGSEEQRDAFLRELRFIDKPVPQIRYELLVLQFTESLGEDFELSLTNSLTEEGDETAYLGTIGSLLNLGFDVVSTFGYNFALRLNAEIANSNSQVLADTTLNGLSGQAISFQNTDTFRYRDQEIDPDTGEQSTTGVTREITSGLIIDVTGWVSGDGMITMQVSSTISSRGSTTSETDNPPPTSERVVSTHVRTPSGRPVVISGLIQQETTISESRTPILGSIPLLGRLFRSRTETNETTELAVYIVPYLEYPYEESIDTDTTFELLYEEFVQR